MNALNHGSFGSASPTFTRPPLAWDETPEHLAYMRRAMLTAADRYRVIRGWRRYGPGSGFAQRMRRGFLADALTYRRQYR